ncbi:MAG: flavodoxin [bacterium]|nr:flavodoxin [bacterium]
MMRVLVAIASKHGATAEIGEPIGRRLSEHGIEPLVVDVADAPSPAGFAAAVLGSGVYAGSWIKAAKNYVETHDEVLAEIPVWFLSSGPIGDPPKPEGEKAVDVTELTAKVDPQRHAILSGALDKDKLNLAERAIVAAVCAPEGDFRDWDAIDDWADEIATVLLQN